MGNVGCCGFCFPIIINWYCCDTKDTACFVARQTTQSRADYETHLIGCFLLCWKMLSRLLDKKRHYWSYSKLDSACYNTNRSCKNFQMIWQSQNCMTVTTHFLGWILDLICRRRFIPVTVKMGENHWLGKSWALRDILLIVYCLYKLSCCQTAIQIFIFILVELLLPTLFRETSFYIE